MKWRWKDNIKKNVWNIGCGISDWTELPQNI
jgi:hypothetical protein